MDEGPEHAAGRFTNQLKARIAESGSLVSKVASYLTGSVILPGQDLIELPDIQEPRPRLIGNECLREVATTVVVDTLGVDRGATQWDSQTPEEQALRVAAACLAGVEGELMAAGMLEVYRPVVFGAGLLSIEIAQTALDLAGLSSGRFAARLMARRVLTAHWQQVLLLYTRPDGYRPTPMTGFRIGNRTIVVTD